jgi:diguanylate cyclase (GGDEF)-like protein
VTTLALGVVAAFILLVVRHYEITQAEQAAVGNATYATRSVLAHELVRRDLGAPAVGRRREQLDALFGAQMNIGGVIGVSLVGARDRITYSTDHAAIGRRESRTRVGEARSGVTVSETADGTTLGHPARGKVLRTFVPLVLEQGRVAGVVVFDQDYATVTTAADKVFLPVASSLEIAVVALLLLLGPLLARVTRRIKLQIAEIRFRATHDDLTGLANRPQFTDEIGARLSAQSDERLAVLFVDLDRFKEINDTLGHGAGDELLRAAGERLLRALPADGVVARLGGDEFGIVFRGDASTARAVGRNVCDALAAPFAIRGLQVSIEGSVGIAIAPEHGTEENALLQHADVAMYRAKARQSQVEIYDPSDDTSDARGLTILTELRDGLAAGDLLAYFQAKVDMSSGLVSGAETLVRWRHPTQGILGPGEFLPWAERTGLGKEINRFILREAIRRCAEWGKLGLELDVSANLTMIDLLDLDLPQFVGGVLREHGLPPERLTLEVTETIIMAERDRVMRVMRDLEAMGVKLSIDDFGTGYSSLTHLRQLPVHEVKVDQSFVRGVVSSAEDEQVVRWTVGLGRSLGLKVVAEGIEHADQWDVLKSLGCDVAQGYFIGRPVPDEEFVALAVRTNERRPALSVVRRAAGDLVIVPAQA